MVRGHRPAGEAMEVAVPHVQQAQTNRQILCQWRGAKVLIHGMRTRQKFSKALGTNRNRQGQPNGRPHRITPAHPIPKPKGGGDAKGIGRRDVGGQRRKVSGNIAATLRLKPGLGRSGIGHGLNGGESLARHQKQRALRFDLFQHRIELMTVHVRDKVNTLGWCRKFIQGEHCHLWPKVRAANADVDHVSDTFVGTHGFRKGQHGVQRVMHLRQLTCYRINIYPRLFHLGERRIS